jgi:mannonate dehydratase
MMRETWRWFGPFDEITLPEVAQTGAQGIVSALHDVPYGQVWSQEKIRDNKGVIEAAGFTWDVVESLPIHEDIKKGKGKLEKLFANYRQSMANLANEGVKTICYNFMPVLDWTRTDLAAPVKNGGTCLRFSAAKMAAFEVHMIGREAARDDYSQEAVAKADVWFQRSNASDQKKLLVSIMSGLPGAFDRYDIDGLKTELEEYEGITRDSLRGNYKRFLEEIIPTAQELGMRLCVHPDDPPRDILGLPRIVSSQEDIAWILGAVDETANGLTLCSGSLGANPENDVTGIAKRFGPRIHFAHLRNVRKEVDGSFEESEHLTGDVDMTAVIKELLHAEARSGQEIPYRPDHGHDLLGDWNKQTQAGYPLIGRLRGLAEIRGCVHAIGNLSGEARQT